MSVSYCCGAHRNRQRREFILHSVSFLFWKLDRIVPYSSLKGNNSDVKAKRYREEFVHVSEKKKNYDATLPVFPLMSSQCFSKHFQPVPTMSTPDHFRPTHTFAGKPFQKHAHVGLSLLPCNKEHDFIPLCKGLRSANRADLRLQTDIILNLEILSQHSH